jgi:hypothetical protein
MSSPPVAAILCLRSPLAWQLPLFSPFHPSRQKSLRALRLCQPPAIPPESSRYIRTAAPTACSRRILESGNTPPHRRTTHRRPQRPKRTWGTGIPHPCHRMHYPIFPLATRDGRIFAVEVELSRSSFNDDKTRGSQESQSVRDMRSPHEASPGPACTALLHSNRYTCSRVNRGSVWIEVPPCLPTSSTVRRSRIFSLRAL